MNKDEILGGARYVGGKVEKAVGDAVDSRDWQVDGVVDQFAGGLQHGYGRAKSIIDDAVDSAPELVDEARDRLKDVGTRLSDFVQKGSEAAVQSVRDEPMLWVAAAVVAGYGIARLVHGGRD